MKLVNKHSKQFYVYELKDNGIAFYVGKGKGDRINHHLQPGSLRKRNHKNAKIKKMIAAGKEVERIILSYHEIEEDAFNEEKRLIAFYGKENLTNNEDGGQGGSGRIVSIETRKKTSMAHKGRVKSLEERANISKALTGVPFSEERKIKLRLLRKPMTEETKRKMSENRKGKNLGPRPQSVIDKIKANHRNRKWEHGENWQKWNSDPNKKLRGPITKKEKLAASVMFKGKPRSEEVKKKISEGHRIRRELKEQQQRKNQ